MKKGNLWRATIKHALETEPLNEEITTDVVIIGGGFTGLSAALYIAQKHSDVCVLEAETIGHGGSGRNVGYVNAGLWTPPDEVEKLVGKESGQKLNSLLADGPNVVFDLIERHQIECSATRQATLHCADTQSGKRDLEMRHKQLSARGAPVELLNQEATQERTGARHFVASLMDPRAGTIQPLAYAQGLARAAVNAGARFFQHTQAISLENLGDTWVVKTTNGSVRARKLIQATNAYGTEGLHENDFVPVYYFQLATEPLSEDQRAEVLPGLEGCWDTATVMSSFRLDEDGRLLVGAVGNLNGPGAAIHKAWARRKLKSLYPKLGHLKFDHEWCGRIAMTSDHLPKVVSIGPAAISIFGYSGRGISPGTVFGRCAAKWATESTEDAFPIPIKAPKADRFKRFKSIFYETGATLTHLFKAWI